MKGENNMSAYIVTDEHLNYLVSYGSIKRVTYWDEKTQTHNEIYESEQKVFNLLFRANVDSVNARYRENTPPMPGRFKLMLENFDPVQVLKSCACFNYQACEVDNYDDTLAAKVIENIRHKAINSLPGYEKAAWGAPEYIQRKAVA